MSHLRTNELTTYAMLITATFRELIFLLAVGTAHGKWKYVVYVTQMRAIHEYDNEIGEALQSLECIWGCDFEEILTYAYDFSGGHVTSLVVLTRLAFLGPRSLGLAITSTNPSFRQGMLDKINIYVWYVRSPAYASTATETLFCCSSQRALPFPSSSDSTIPHIPLPRRIT